MDGESCCFIGHRKVNDVDSVTERVKSVVEILLSQGVKRYLFGSKSEFNDVCGKDVICKMSEDVNKDVRLIVAKDFTLWQDGERIGEASPETIAQVPKLP